MGAKTYPLERNNPHCGEGIKVVTTEDGEKFVWKVIDNRYAKMHWNEGLFALYALHDDDSESEIDNRKDLLDYIERGVEIGIEVGFLPEE